MRRAIGKYLSWALVDRNGDLVSGSDGVEALFTTRRRANKALTVADVKSGHRVARVEFELVEIEAIDGK